MSITIERLKQNIEAVDTLMESSDVSLESIVKDYMLPMLKELMEAQVEEYEDFDEEDEENSGFQVVELRVSTVSMLESFLRSLTADFSLPSQLRNQALRAFAMLRSEIDGIALEKVVEQLLIEAQQLKVEVEQAADQGNEQAANQGNEQAADQGNEQAANDTPTKE